MTEHCVQYQGFNSTMVNAGTIPQNNISSFQSSCVENMALQRSNGNFQKNNTKKQKLKGIFCKVETCGERFATAELFELHNKIHEGVKPFICDVCRKVCQTESKLIAHKSSHANDGIRPLCNICNRSFSSQSALNKHKKILHKSKPYICPECKAGFEKYQYMMIHAKREHGIENVEKFKGNNSDPVIIVDKTDNLIDDSLLRSNNSVDKINEKNNGKDSDIKSNTPKNTEDSKIMSETLKILCQMCTSTFPSQEYLEQHMAVHICERSESHIPKENSVHPVNHVPVRTLNPYPYSRHNLKTRSKDDFVNYAISDSYSEHVASNRINNDPGSFTFVSHRISHSVGIGSLSDIKQSHIYGNSSAQGVIPNCYNNTAVGITSEKKFYTR